MKKHTQEYKSFIDKNKCLRIECLNGDMYIIDNIHANRLGMELKDVDPLSQGVFVCEMTGDFKILKQAIKFLENGNKKPRKK